MKIVTIEATNHDHGGINWGKFLIGQFDEDEWGDWSMVSNTPLLKTCGWSPADLLVLDLQTGEGAIFSPGGYAKADLDKHKIWVCPMFEPFLTWLYTQDLADLDTLPTIVRLDAPSDITGYRRGGR
jgi:hypothetical protein